MDRPRPTSIVLGTRGSDLARAQTQLVIDALKARWAGLQIETKIIKTRGDNPKTASLDVRAGRKGLFTGEIERALVGREIDLAVHSAKDLPSALTPGTEIVAVLSRAPVEDVLVATTPCNLDSLIPDGIVATGSVRRKHQLRWKRPDVEVVDLHGNVPTRLRKLASDEWHGIILARAGVERLGLKTSERCVTFEGRELSMAALPSEIFLPAGGQGIIALQARSDDEQLRELAEGISDFNTRLCLRAEREFLRLLHADCNQPVGVLALIESSVMKIRAHVFEIGATTPHQAFAEGPAADAERLAAQLMPQINGEKQ
jgi:hydroxymethylbilane synthase